MDNVNDNASDVKSFYCKKTITRKAEVRPKQCQNNGDDYLLPWDTATCLNIEVSIPLKYLSNFWRFSDWTLINCEIELDLLWEKTVYW